MTDETELMPCPYCGGEQYIKNVGTRCEPRYTVDCLNRCLATSKCFYDVRDAVSANSCRANLVPTNNLRQPNYLKQVPTRTAYGVGEILSDEDLHAITSTKMDTKYDYLNKELEEQARLNGMGAERELALMAKLEALRKSHAELLGVLKSCSFTYLGDQYVCCIRTKKVEEAITNAEKLLGGEMTET